MSASGGRIAAVYRYVRFRRQDCCCVRLCQLPAAGLLLCTLMSASGGRIAAVYSYVSFRRQDCCCVPLCQLPPVCGMLSTEVCWWKELDQLIRSWLDNGPANCFNYFVRKISILFSAAISSYTPCGEKPASSIQVYYVVCTSTVLIS